MQPILRRERFLTMDAVAGWNEGSADALLVYGATAAFPEFYAASRDSIARALALTLGDADLAADAADEAMARAYLRWSQVGSMENPAGWSYRVGLNWARSVSRRLRQPVRTIYESDSVESPPMIEPALVAALKGLSVRNRSVVVCRYLLGYSDAETSRALEMRPGTVRSCLHRALRQLAVELDHLRHDDPRTGHHLAGDSGNGDDRGDSGNRRLDDDSRQHPRSDDRAPRPEGLRGEQDR